MKQRTGVSKTIWGILIAGGVLAAFMLLFSPYRENLRAEEELAAELENVRGMLDSLPATGGSIELKALANEIAAARVAAREMASRLSYGPDATADIAALFRLAEENGVRLVGVSSATPENALLGEVPCRLYITDLEAEGNTSQLRDFLGAVGQHFSTAWVKSMELGILPSAVGSAPPPATAKIRLGLYSYGDGGAR